MEPDLLDQMISMMEEFRNISVLLLAAQPGLHLTLFRQLCAAAADGDQAVGGEDGRLQPDQQQVQRRPAQPHVRLPRAAGLQHQRILRVLRAVFRHSGEPGLENAASSYETGTLGLSLTRF